MILLAVAALIGAVMLSWLAASIWYRARRRAYECTLAASLEKLAKRFGIDAGPDTFSQSCLAMRDGTCLTLYTKEGPPGAPVFVFMPGTAVYAQLYAQILVDMHARGFTAIGYDPRGHGRSGTRRGVFTIPQMIDDARAVCAYAARRYGRPVTFSGSSQGGVVALYLAATGDPAVATVVCHNIAYLDGDTIRQISILKPPLFLMPFLLWLFRLLSPWSFPVTWYLPFSKLRTPDGGSAVELMEHDPMATLAYSMGAIASLAKTTPAVPIDRIAMPVMLVSGTRDEVFPVAYERRIFAMLTCPKRFELVEGARHLMIMKPPRKVIDTIVDWIGVHGGSPASGGSIP